MRNVIKTEVTEE